MALPTFASYSDITARLNDETLDEDQVEAYIADASAMLYALMGSHYNEDSELQAQTLKAVCCNMVARALSASASGAGFGVTQWSQTASSFNEQRTFSNPSGDLYLTTAEKKMLGIGRSAVFTVETSIRPGYPLASSIEPEDES